MREEGLNPDAWLRAPIFNEALARVVSRLLVAADRLYQRGSTGISALPRDCRGAILAAATIYAEIGSEIAGNAMDSVNQRAMVGSARKLTLLCIAKIRAQMPPRCDTAPPLQSIAYLAEACAQVPGHTSGRPFPKRSFDERCEWLIDLFERLSLPQGRH